MPVIHTGSRLNNGISSASPLRDNISSAKTAPLAPMVLVVDEDTGVRESLERMSTCQSWRAETFASAEEFLAFSLDLVPCCLVLEISLPGLSGLELQQHMVAERPDIPIIFLSSTSNVRTTVRAMKAGAVEFFTKPFRNEELLKAIRKAHKQSCLAFARQVEKQLLKGCYALLSRRERQVMALVSCGLLNKQIGGELGISEITVKAHRSQMMRKMRANSVASLVMMAAKLGLAGPKMPMHDQNANRAAHLSINNLAVMHRPAFEIRQIS